MDYPDIRLFHGDQGQGKSISAVACVVDDYHEHINAIVSPQGEVLNVRALNEGEQAYVEMPIKDGGLGVPYDNLSHVMAFSDDGSKTKIISIPEDYYVLSDVRIFANFHFWGIKFVYTDMEMLITYINTDLMTDAWLVLDESIITDKRDTMTIGGKTIAWFAAQVAKRNLHVIVLAQYLNMVQSRFHLFATTRVECSYDSDTAFVELKVNKNSPVMNSTSYWSYPYRRFYRREELVPIPQGKIDRAVETIVG